MSEHLPKTHEHLANPLHLVRCLGQLVMQAVDRIDVRYASAINPFSDDDYPPISRPEAPALNEEELDA